MTRPLLFIDVDGVLNPESTSSGRRPEGYETHRMRPSGWDSPRQKPLRVWLNPAHGPQLLSLPYDLVWATTWMHEANEWISPHLGLPELPVVTFHKKFMWPLGGHHWKTRELVEYAAGRPFAWLDDQIRDNDGVYVGREHPGRCLLLQVAPLTGLRDDHLQKLRAWAADLEERGSDE